MDPIRFWVRVEGRVQGVGFRWFVRDQAENLGLTGWVRNESDGSVEGEIQGVEDSIERMLLALEQGPCASKVEALQKNPRTVSKGEKGFQIRY